MLRQYLDLKEQAGAALLLYRMGDFYELFFEDAQIAAPVLGIALTKRRHNDNVEAPMCGVPHHAFGSYIGKLLDAGYRVAVAEQVEDPATAKGLVRREIVRTHTPGTVSETDLLEGSERCYLAAYGDDGESLALAWIEVSTGTFEGLRCDNPRVLTEHLAQIRPRELLVAEGWDDWKSLWPADLEVPTLSPMEPEPLLPQRRRAATQTGPRGRIIARVRTRVRRKARRDGRRPPRLYRIDPEGGASPPETVCPPIAGRCPGHRPRQSEKPRNRARGRWLPLDLSGRGPRPHRHPDGLSTAARLDHDSEHRHRGDRRASTGRRRARGGCRSPDRHRDPPWTGSPIWNAWRDESGWLSPRRANSPP